MNHIEGNLLSFSSNQKQANSIWMLCMKMKDLGYGQPDYRTMLREKEYLQLWIIKARSFNNNELNNIIDQLEFSNFNSEETSRPAKIFNAQFNKNNPSQNSSLPKYIIVALVIVACVAIISVAAVFFLLEDKKESVISKNDFIENSVSPVDVRKNAVLPVLVN